MEVSRIAHAIAPFIVVGAATSMPTADAADTGRCPRHASDVVLAENSRFVLYRRRSDSARRTIMSCSRRTGFQIALGYLAFDEERFFPPPAIHLRGGTAAFAVQGDRANDFHGTALYAGPLPETQPPEGKAAFGAWSLIYPQIQDQPVGAPKIGSVRISHQGSVAWIQCQAGDDIQENASARHTCTRPGFVNRVRVHRKGAPSNESIQLDRGRRIDPRSLRLRGDLLTWLHSGKRRTARLP